MAMWLGRRSAIIEVLCSRVMSGRLTKSRWPRSARPWMMVILVLIAYGEKASMKPGYEKKKVRGDLP